MLSKPIIILAALLSTTSAIAHNAPKHSHDKLIPIPSYSHNSEEASGKLASLAAKKLLASFSDELKAQASFKIGATERKKWSNLPAGIVTRSGVSVGELSDQQRILLFKFLSSALGEKGYQNVMNIMAAEAFLSHDTRRAKRLKWYPENYYISFYGSPDEDEWGWQYGGHHLAINISLKDKVVISMSPTFIGTEPAIFTYEGKDYSSVMPMHLAGFAVYDALNDAQKDKADARYVPTDVLTGPGQLGVIPPIVGLSVSEMDQKQKDLLLKAIAEWVEIQPKENAEKRMAEIEANLDKLHFAWRGNDEVNTPTYMRIQGSDLIIELLSTGGNVGANASGQGHYHTIYRNLSKEYGQ